MIIEKTLKSLLAAGCLASLAACMPPLKKLPEETKVGVAPEWRHHPYNEVQADVSPAWWGQFGDPVLSKLVDRALQNNVSLQKSRAAVERAQAQVLVAQSLLWPSLTGTAAGSRSKSPNALPIGPDYSYSSVGQPGFLANYELDIWGKNFDRASAAAYQVSSQEAAAESVRISIIAATAQTYVTLRALDARLELLEKTLETRQASMDRIRERVKHGYSPDLELNQAQVEYAATKQQIPQVKQTIAETENALSALVGVPPQAIPRGKAFEEFIVPDTPATLPSTLLNSRPDIAQAEFTLAAADRSLSAARKDFLPSVNLAANINWLFSSALANDPYNVWKVGGSILAPIFTGGRLTGQYEMASADQKLAALEYKDTVIKAFSEVENQLAAVDFLKEQAEAQRMQLSASETAYRHANSRYQEGYSPYLEVVDAQRGLLAIQTATLQTHAQRLNASIALYKALGGGWRREYPGQLHDKAAP